MSTVEFAPGDMLLVSGTLKCFETSRNEGGFDSRMYYKSIGIHYKMTAEDVTVLTRKRQTVGYLLSELRLKIKEVYEQIGTKEKAGLYSSIVLGDKSSLDGDIKSFTSATALHICWQSADCTYRLWEWHYTGCCAAQERHMYFLLRQERFYNRICSDDRKCAIRTAGIGDVSFDDVCTGARKNI